MLIATLSLAAIALAAAGLLSSGGAFAQRAGGTYRGDLQLQRGSGSGAISITVSPNGHALSDIEFLDVSSGCIRKAMHGNTLNRPMDLLSPPFLQEGVAFNAYDYHIPNDEPQPGDVNFDISIYGTFISDSVVRGALTVSGYGFFPPPEITPPEGDLCPELTRGGYFNETFAFEATLVSAPPPTQPPGFRLPDTGSGPASSGVAVPSWPLLAAALLGASMALGGLGLKARRR